MAWATSPCAAVPRSIGRYPGQSARAQRSPPAVQYARVKRLARYTLASLTIFSLLLCLLICFAWLRSFRLFETIEWDTANGRAFISSSGGRGAIAYVKILEPVGQILDPIGHGGTIYRRNGDPLPLADEGPSLSEVGHHVHCFLFDWRDGHSTEWFRRWRLILPWWLPFTLTALLPALALQHRLRHARRARTGFCPKCDYDLRATPNRCPECGSIPAGAKA